MSTDPTWALGSVLGAKSPMTPETTSVTLSSEASSTHSWLECIPPPSTPTVSKWEFSISEQPPAPARHAPDHVPAAGDHLLNI